MTEGVLKWLKPYLATLARTARVLDVGAFDINGSPRKLILGGAIDGLYIGLDMRAGPGVDVVANAHQMPFRDAQFDCVICAETLEHDDEPTRTCSEIFRISKRNAIVLITVPGIGFKRHDYPSDYWRCTIEGLRVWMRAFQEHIVEEDRVEHSVRGMWFK